MANTVITLLNCQESPKIEGNGNLPIIPAGAESSSPEYALGVAWDSTSDLIDDLDPSTLQATART